MGSTESGSALSLHIVPTVLLPLIGVMASTESGSALSLHIVPTVLCQGKRCWHPAQTCTVNEYHRPVCVCPTVCPAIEDPVCGTDGLSYPNECEMKMTSCVLGDVGLAVDYKGRCKSKHEIMNSDRQLNPFTPELKKCILPTF